MSVRDRRKRLPRYCGAQDGAEGVQTDVIIEDRRLNPRLGFGFGQAIEGGSPPKEQIACMYVACMRSC